MPSGDFESIARRIIEDNRRSRSESNDRTSRLLDVLYAKQQLFSETINELLDEATGSRKKDGSILGEDGEVESSDGSAGGAAHEEGDGGAATEPGG